MHCENGLARDVNTGCDMCACNEPCKVDYVVSYEIISQFIVCTLRTQFMLAA